MACMRAMSRMKATREIYTVKICQDYFNFELPSSIIEKRRKTFVDYYVPIS